MQGWVDLVGWSHTEMVTHPVLTGLEVQYLCWYAKELYPYVSHQWKMLTVVTLLRYHHPFHIERHRLNIFSFLITLAHHRCISPLSIVSQHKLASVWGIQKQRSVPALWSQDGLYIVFTLHHMSWKADVVAFVLLHLIVWIRFLKCFTADVVCLYLNTVKT